MVLQGANDPRVLKKESDEIVAAVKKNNVPVEYVLFPDEACAVQLEAAGWLKRTGVQFRWHNQNYANFEAFLATLSHDKRKKTPLTSGNLCAFNPPDCHASLLDFFALLVNFFALIVA